MNKVSVLFKVVIVFLFFIALALFFKTEQSIAGPNGWGAWTVIAYYQCPNPNNVMQVSRCVSSNQNVCAPLGALSVISCGGGQD